MGDYADQEVDKASGMFDKVPSSKTEGTETSLEGYKITKETDKAVLYQAVNQKICGNRIDKFTFSLWVPKSIIKNGEVPSWFLKKNQPSINHSNSCYHNWKVESEGYSDSAWYKCEHCGQRRWDE